MSEFLRPADYIDRHGTAGPAWTPKDSRAYTRWLARSHYENFHVVSFLLPRRLHQDFYNVYGFCRWADDLGDEMGSAQRSLELLEWWRSELAGMYAGRTRHPVFVALAETVAAHRIPQQPFSDLIRAFVRDQSQTRYETYDDLLDYCRDSANPVGRLVLHVCGYTNPERTELSDFTCTALQLANFWQDVERDWSIGRVYLPLDDMARNGYSLQALEVDVERRVASEPFRRMMRELVDRAEELFHRGSPLVRTVNRRLAIDLDLFTRGGLAILERIRRQDYDVLASRPVLGWRERLPLLVRSVARQLFETGQSEPVRGRSAA